MRGAFHRKPSTLSPTQTSQAYAGHFRLISFARSFKEAQTVWNGGRFDYEVDTWAGGLRPIETANGLLKTRICQHGPNDVFILRYRDDLLSADNLDVYLRCTAVALESNGAAGQVHNLGVARGDGRTFSVVARTYILACGGVENVQLLLSSDVTQPGEEGNRHDNIGRYVTDHPEFRMGLYFSEPLGRLREDCALRHPSGRSAYGERISDDFDRR